MVFMLTVGGQAVAPQHCKKSALGEMPCENVLGKFELVK